MARLLHWNAAISNHRCACYPIGWFILTQLNVHSSREMINERQSQNEKITTWASERSSFFARRVGVYNEQA